VTRIWLARLGAGGGSASLPLAPPARELIAVDESQAMLDVFAEAAEWRGVRHTEIVGRWPDVAPGTPHAGVVVCCSNPGPSSSADDPPSAR